MDEDGYRQREPGHYARDGSALADRKQKINATNSWNFALIDYFHDMSLLKEGDGVNFQKASCTLDGCVKIYTSRVDSVATETGKLLSGLADSGNKARKTNEVEDNDAEDDEEADGEDGTKKKTKRRVQRSSEMTLVSSFAQLQLKKMELEFAVDPLFKKASADFDEGGAKGLLLNHLTIDAHGRIVFDSSDDTQESDHKPAGKKREDVDDEVDEERGGDREELQDQDDDEVTDVAQLGARFLPNLSQLDELDICPSLKAFELGGGDDSLDIPFLKAPEDWRKQQSALEDQSKTAQEVADYDPLPGLDDNGGMNGFDGGVDVGFGEGGEAWVKHAAISTVSRSTNVDSAGDGDELDPENSIRAVGAFKNDGTSYGVAVDHGNSNDHENILNYFDEALRKNWAGPEHWRIKKVKDSSKPVSQAAKKREKVPFEINFAAPMTQALSDTIFTPATSNSTICLPRMQWRSKTRNLLPDDKHFNSRQLLRLFLKPKARVGAVRSINVHGVQNHQTLQDEGEMDGAFWARQQAETAAAEPGNEPVQGNYDANFFQDDGLGLPSAGPDDDDEDFADARETLSPRLDNLLQDTYGSQENAGHDVAGGFGSQLVTQSRRIRPEYVQYARIAKKVDVRRLKEEMWKGLGLDVSLSDVRPTSLSDMRNSIYRLSLHIHNSRRRTKKTKFNPIIRSSISLQS